MTDIHTALMIAVIALVTAGLRFLPFLIFGETRTTPPLVSYLGQVLPYAIMGMLVVYCLKGITFTAAPFGIPEIIGCASVILLHIWKRNTLLSIGAGTVINAEQCEAALAAGAQFIVSPGLSVAVAKICNERNIPYYPGCVTPTEIMQALELGITTVKFFPANVYGGLKALKALSAPFPQVKFIPTGGVDRSNIDEFLAFDKIAAIGGSFFVKESLEKMEEENK